MHESTEATTVDHVARNHAAWDHMAAEVLESGRRNWARDEITWGIFDVPESRIGMLPGPIWSAGCGRARLGTGYVSAWLARRGARPVGIDNSPVQLETARRLQAEFGLHVSVAHSATPRRHRSPMRASTSPSASKAPAIWCDPYQLIPEAARILRPGGRLSFLGNSVLLMLTTQLTMKTRLPASSCSDHSLE